MKVPIEYYSMKVLQEPQKGRKGALILSQVDGIVNIFPFVKDIFYLIERRGWRGLNKSRYADIKLVEDLSLWDKTIELFPKSICLDIGPADFVDTTAFKPLMVQKDYDGMQISHWSNSKRPELFIKAAGLLPHLRFLKFGHFINGGSPAECELRDNCIRISREFGATIDFPYSDATSNTYFPNSKEEINGYINRAKLGILTTKAEGINRFKLECLAAGIPVLVPNDTSYPTKKHINLETGFEYEPTPEGLAKAIEEALEGRHRFHPRNYIERTTGKPIALAKLKGALKKLCQRDGQSYTYQKIEWDGRNQSLVWGIGVLRKLNGYQTY